MPLRGILDLTQSSWKPGVETRDGIVTPSRDDIGFARVVKGERGPVRVVIQGDVGRLTDTTQGDYRGREINSVSAEIMVLSRSTPGCRFALVIVTGARRQ